MITLPDGVLGMADRGPDWAAWVDRLPAMTGELLREWELTPDGWPMHGYCSLVVPARLPDGAPVVLKLTVTVDDESEYEHLALQHWQGNGAVRLLRADPRRRAILLERLHTDDLTDRWDLEACEVVGGLYEKLHLPALPQLRQLTTYVHRWTDGLRRLPREAPIPRRLVEQAITLSDDLCADEQSTAVLIHGDLHYLNVLAADREPWLAIDPKPMNGDAHYEPAPMLWNRFEELDGDVRAGLRRRFHTIVDTAGLDEDRARDWVVVRMVHNALWTIQDSEGRALSAEDREWITQCVAIAKAVQD